MIVRKDFITKLKEFSLNSYEGKLWVALLSRGVSTAGELSDISEVPRSRAYDVLESLEKKGFIISKVGKPLKYMAIPPREVIDRVKKRLMENAHQKTETLESIRGSEMLNQLNELFSTGIELVDPADKSGAFRGRERVYEHLTTMIKNAQKSVVLMTTKEGLRRKADTFALQLKKAAQRGVQVRIAAPVDGNKDVADQFGKFAQVRNSARDTRFVIVDGRELLLMVTDDKKTHKNYDSAVWVDAPYFVKHFQEMFDTDWEKMK